MSLFDSASLVVTPNGYKATKLYSVIPSDGTGDMTFARAGNTATRVNASGYIQAVNADIPRLDYFGGGCPKLLLEPQRTNLSSYSNDFTNGNYSPSGITITANDTQSPDGTTNAAKFTALAGSGFRQLIRNHNLSSGQTSISFFAKGGTKDFIFFSIYSSNIFPGGFNYQDTTITLSTNGVVTGGTINPTFKIENYGNGWKRINCSFNAINAGTLTVNFGLSKTSSQPNGTFDGTETSYFYGFQLEAGSYATSYIPTTTAAVTRNADDCYKTGISSLIGQASGTLFIDYNFQQYDSSVKVLNVLGITDNDVSLTYISSNLRLLVTNNANIVINQNYAGFYNSGRYKIAFAYSLNNAALYINGTQVATFNNCSFNFTSAYRLSLTANNNFYGDFDLNSTALWKTRLSNAELAALTSL